ncbi:uncharacterized protein LOC141729059 [Zonotrichia albicollis]|uniref:uncharacterized protein LOC141729059 n=1 Tax=Zonotrichia albicollis TaxID=44394 RepID=UPI003D80C0AB
MASHLLSLLVGKQPRWHLPALAFFLPECPEQLSVLRPVTASQHSLVLHTGRRNTRPLSTPGGAAGRSRHRDGRDNSHVQLLSIQLFGKLMELVVEEGNNVLTTVVSQSLLPLFLHWHHENLHVAEACGEALLGAARFLRRRDLEELLRKKRRMKFVESLLLQDESRAAEHLRWALPHLQSPQRPLREAAVRFIGEPAARRPSPPPGPPAAPAYSGSRARAAAAPPALGAAATPEPCQSARWMQRGRR